MSRPLIYEPSVLDAETQLPVAVIDSSALPHEADLPDVDGDIPELLSEFPRREFVIVFFASRAPRTPQVNWLRKVHGLLSRNFKKRIRRVYIVHAKWITRALNRALAPIVSPKFAAKLYFVKNIGELSHYMDVTAIDINPRIYCDDIERCKSETYAHIPVPKRCRSIFGRPLEPVPTSYWTAALNFLNKVDVSSSTFMPVHHMLKDEADLVHVLRHAVAREQTLRLYDYGPMAVLAVLKEYMLALPEPLIHMRQIELPPRDTNEYAESILARLRRANLRHLNDLMSFCTPLLPRVSSQVMSRSLGPAVMRLRDPGADKLAISARVFRHLLENWADLDLYEERKSSAAASAVDQRIDDVQSLDERSLSPASSDADVRSLDTRELEADLLTLGLKEALPGLPGSSERRPALLTPDPEESLALSRVTSLSSTEMRMMPRNFPSEVPPRSRQKQRVPNKRAYGKVAEIMKMYDEGHAV